MNQRRYALAAAVAAAIVALAVVAAGLRAEPPFVSPAPATATPIADAPRVIFTRLVVFGGGMMTGAYDAFVVLSAGRPSDSRRIAGAGVGTPVFDGRDRVAYWRTGSIAPSSGTVSGAYEVVVWDLRADRERVLLTLKDERSNGDLLWSADRRSLVVPTRATTATGGGLQTRLLLIDADGGTMRVIHTAAPDAAIRPLFADAQVVVGIRGSSYVVLDAISGVLRTQTPLRVRPSFMSESAEFATNPDGTVLELLRRFESDSGPLRIWNIRDPGVDIAKVDQRGIWDPIFWPGRTEVVLSGATGLMALDYRTGLTRQLVSSSRVHRIVAVESGGRYALAQTESALQIFERTGDELKARPDLSFAIESTLRPIGVFLP